MTKRGGFGVEKKIKEWKHKAFNMNLGGGGGGGANICCQEVTARKSKLK